MPLSNVYQDVVLVEPVDTPYFTSLSELDEWSSQPRRKLRHLLKYIPREHEEAQKTGKLMGGYKEQPLAFSYTFNFWSLCENFVYFSHHRVTIPPPGWVNAAHRQGVKILGTLIFEASAAEDCLRLLVGQLPQSPQGTVTRSKVIQSVPISPHYARVLAELAEQRGFDGYLLNFECPLHGRVEQARALATWVSILRDELRARVGAHAEISWYDSVVVNGRLAWQDRLNSRNLPFFLASTSFFSNYTWSKDYPERSVEYFLSLQRDVIGDALDNKSIQDIYMGIDVWGRGQHGGGGLGCYRALDHVSPPSLGLSVALFGQAWTWETEQHKPGFTWDVWWAHERTLWVGLADNISVVVPDPPLRHGEKPCLDHGPFVPISSFFTHHVPPDPRLLPFHTTFCPGAGRAWFVEGRKVAEFPAGWTDVDKQTALGDVWPIPHAVWHDQVSKMQSRLTASAEINMDDAWNGGSSLRIAISAPDAKEPVWVPIQTLSLTANVSYDVVIIYKAADGIELEPHLTNASSLSAQTQTALPNGWVRASCKVTNNVGGKSDVGLVLHPSESPDLALLIGQINVYPTRQAVSEVEVPLVLWVAHELETRTASKSTSSSEPPAVPATRQLTWDVAITLPPPTLLHTMKPEDPVPAWKTPPASSWFPGYLYFNIYVQAYARDGTVSSPDDDPELCVWLGTTGMYGRARHFDLPPIEKLLGMPGIRKDAVILRYYVRGVTDTGEVGAWSQAGNVDIPVGDLSEPNSGKVSST
ncbi:hypothetical protein FISHEDRAFT_66793 [Fistulina hepatica ATCC 64428]|uniref:Cytosolic endo-beta-N-acetylglucosaminidase TIM barrel domain-containing protein n=1 Tax=Fistulina hepatica ATCC 64428 TaxID=1128425 RepID=A0A0D7A4I5_9AGAR|nr:hypothetical protein FISHEDRAFT_66793 [Fistulina hepatica ATCC 64428]